MKDKDFSEYGSSNTVRGIPRSHWKCHLYNFHNPKPKLVEGVDKLMSEWQSGHIPAPKLILTGQQGRGKTHIAVGVYRHAVYEKDLSQCAYMYVPDFCKEVKRGYSGNEDLFLDIEPKSLVVLDDIFGMDMSEHDINNIIARLITTSYNNNQALVVTSHYTIKGISEILHPHELSRLFQNSFHVELKSNKDQRL